MTDDTPPIEDAAERRSGATLSPLLLAACATLLLLGVMAAGGYFLYAQLRRIEHAPPVAPPEVTRALEELHSQLQAQRREHQRQLQTLQNELRATQEQAAAPQPDLATLKEELATLREVMAHQAEEAQRAEAAAAALPETAMPHPSQTTSTDDALRAYVALRARVRAGAPYADALAALAPHLPDRLADAVVTLQEHAAEGLPPEEEAEEAAALADESALAAEESDLPRWAQRLNERLPNLIAIRRHEPAMREDARPVAEPPSAADTARADAFAALDAIETFLMGE